MNKRKTVAVYGGSFNPPHNGHLQLAKYLIESEIVEQVMFMPSFNPPHKDASKMLPYQDRCCMLYKALKHWDPDQYGISYLEEEMGGVSYTLLMLDELSHRWMDCDFKMVIGADELMQLHTWEPDCIRLVRSYDFLICLRPGVSVDLLELNSHWPGWLCQKLLSGIIFDVHMIDASSSNLREAIKQHGCVPEGAPIPAAVANYINEHKLYQGE